MNEIFTPRWFDKVFRPLIQRAAKYGINPRTQDRLIQWMRDHKDDNVRCLWGTIREFQYDAGSEWDDFVNDALTEIE